MVKSKKKIVAVYYVRMKCKSIIKCIIRVHMLDQVWQYPVVRSYVIHVKKPEFNWVNFKGPIGFIQWFINWATTNLAGKKGLWGAIGRRKQEQGSCIRQESRLIIARTLSFTATIPNLCGSRDWFGGRQFFQRRAGEMVSGWFKHFTFITCFVSVTIISAPPQIIRHWSQRLL